MNVDRRLVIFGGALLFAATLGITLAIGTRATRTATELRDRAEMTAPRRFTYTEFLIDPAPEPGSAPWELYRRQQRRWSEAQRQFYWIPPEDVVIPELERHVDEAIVRLLESVP